MKKILCLILCLGICLSLAACGGKDNSDDNIDGDGTDISTPGGDENNKPTLYTNPLTGEQSEDDYTATHRPIGVMINNAKVALPQYGIDDADITYEALTEYGITRMLCLYSDYRNVEKIGSVRSSRPHFIKFAASHNAIYFHFGGSGQAYALLDQLGIDRVDGQALSKVAFTFDSVRNKTYSKEHCYFTGNEKIDAGLTKKGYTTEGEVKAAYNFVAADQAPISFDTSAKTVTWDFSSYGKNMQLIYNETSGEYEKHEYGSPQVDKSTGSAFSVTNAFILIDKYSRLADIYVDPALQSGSGYYFTKGTCTPITWKKGDIYDQFTYYDTDGNELQVNVGQTYVALVSTDYADDIEIE